MYPLTPSGLQIAHATPEHSSPPANDWLTTICDRARNNGVAHAMHGKTRKKREREEEKKKEKKKAKGKKAKMVTRGYDRKPVDLDRT